ncbi:hypothetical protein J2S03_000067 [Alicyclobacillus cycloheptanicus]|uniref:Uncharacterized protein n=1 Tax=Alicyclobacillus cycloheptanicus TaxID=1457 RepID=A0ABT9XD99_9BACL|nr:hypothetical protein [Alicyclobacillus cycloheptanicus]
MEPSNSVRVVEFGANGRTIFSGSVDEFEDTTGIRLAFGRAVTGSTFEHDGHTYQIIQSTASGAAHTVYELQVKRVYE